MQALIFIPSLLLFLYILYRLVKDDYIFIRKGISLEQSFDIAFITMWSSLFFSRVFYLLFHIYSGENFLFDFFSPGKGGFSLTGAIIGGTLAVYLIGKHNKLPLGRLSDFLSLSFLYTLPLLFLSDALIAKKPEVLFLFLNAAIYFVLLLFFAQFLYPKVITRTIKEGLLSILFLLLFSLISLVTAVLLSLKDLWALITPENITLGLFLLFNSILLVRLVRVSHARRAVQR